MVANRWLVEISGLVFSFGGLLRSMSRHCFLWLLLVVSLVVVVVASRCCSGGKVGSRFFFFGTRFLGFSEQSKFCWLIYFNL